jgi:dihydroorotate dehydrogenase electron transfer subunit
MPEFQEKAPLLLKETITDEIFRFTLHAPSIAGAAHPGQFVMLQITEGFDPLLRRPFSIHQASADGNIQILFKIIGNGTRQLANVSVGEKVNLLGPLGRGFSLNRSDKLCLIGGGIGIAPLYFLAKRLLQSGISPEYDYVFLGSQTKEEVSLLSDEFFDLGYTVITATDDGSFGHHGFITDLIDPILPEMERVYTCGPFPMMRLVALKAMAADTACQVSMETHMACGLGACLGCTITGADGNYIHVCKQGPVVSAHEVAWTL